MGMLSDLSRRLRYLAADLSDIMYSLDDDELDALCEDFAGGNVMKTAVETMREAARVIEVMEKVDALFTSCNSRLASKCDRLSRLARDLMVCLHNCCGECWMGPMDVRKCDNDDCDYLRMYKTALDLGVVADQRESGAHE